MENLGFVFCVLGSVFLCLCSCLLCFGFVFCVLGLCSWICVLVVFVLVILGSGSGSGFFFKIFWACDFLFSILFLIFFYLVKINKLIF